ncbi:MAG: hypothetical protein H3C38_18015 [Rhodospirillales bacterium]|nr:hypothetical protein [Rhodospirillales bacterium]
MSGESTLREIRLQGLLARLPKPVAEGFTARQREALADIADSLAWRGYPVNVRFHLRLLGRTLFVAATAGAERRGPERVYRERRLHPLATLGNLLFLFVASVAFYGVTGLGVMVLSGIVEF